MTDDPRARIIKALQDNVDPPERPKRKRKPKPPGELTEAQLQRQVAELLDRLGLLWFHPLQEAHWTMDPDQQRQAAIRGAILRRSGVKRGVLDVWIIRNGGGVVIELKVGKNKVTPEQHDWAKRLRALDGWQTAVCRSLDEVIEFLRECRVRV